MSWTLAPSGPRGATLTNESTVNCAHDSRSTRDPLEIHSRSTRIELGFEYERGNVARMAWEGREGPGAGGAGVCCAFGKVANVACVTSV